LFKFGRKHRARLREIPPRTGGIPCAGGAGEELLGP
jgi:hypothetical protein